MLILLLKMSHIKLLLVSCNCPSNVSVVKQELHWWVSSTNIYWIKRLLLHYFTIISERTTLTSHPLSVLPTSNLADC